MFNLTLLIFWLQCLFLESGTGDFLSDFEPQVDSVTDELEKFANQNLGVEFFQDHLKNITQKKNTKDGQKILEEFHDSLEERTQLASKILVPIVEAIKDDYKKPSADRPLQSCCEYDASKLQYSSLFRSKVDFNGICEKYSGHNLCPTEHRTYENNAHRMHKDIILEKMKAAYETYAKGKSRHIYYGSIQGYSMSYPAEKPARDKCTCASFDARFRPWFPNIANHETGKEIVILMDFSTSMTDKLLPLAKKIANLLFRTIDTKDKVALRVLVNGGISAPISECLKTLTEAHPSVFRSITTYINAVKTAGSLRYNSAFLDSFHLFEDSKKEKLFNLITSGNFAESNTEAITEFQKALALKNCPAVNIFLLQDKERPISLENRNLHERFVRKSCESCHSDCQTSKKNQLIEVFTDDNEANLRQKVSKIYNSFIDDLGPPKIQFTMPYEDFTGLGTMIDACIRVVDGNVTHGILCLSFLSNELFGVTSEIGQSQNIYPFLIDTSGATYIHPYYADPVLHDNGNRIELTYFEPSQQFHAVYDSMKRGESSHTSFIVNSSIPSGIFGAKNEIKNFTYYWKKVSNSRFSVGVAVSDTLQNDLELNPSTTKGNELYHRLDLQSSTKKKNFCTQNGVIATKEKSVIKIADDAFELPSIYYDAETASSVATMLKYFETSFTEAPRVFKSSTIRNNIRLGVMATNVLNEFWLADNSSEKFLIKWRYVGLENGVFRIFPGRLLPRFDARKELWYHLGKTFPDKMVFASPYIDASTNKALLYLGKQITKELNDTKQVVGVMGMDFELSYLQSVIRTHVSNCGDGIYPGDCSIINTDGFYVYHKDFLNSSQKNLRTNVHLTEKEPEIVKHFLEKKIMIKRACFEYNNQLPRKIWFYSLNDVVTSLEGSGQCFRYWLIPLKKTNLLVLKISHQTNCLNNVQCACAQPQSNEESLGVCRENVNKESCDCPCFEEKACLSEIKDSEKNLICRPRDHSRYANDISIDGVDVKSLKECYPVDCLQFRTLIDCQRYGCKWKSQKCQPIYQLPPTSNADDDDDDKYKMIIVIGVVVVFVIIIIAVIVKVLRNRGSKKSSKETKEKPILGETFQNKAFEDDVYHA